MAHILAPPSLACFDKETNALHVTCVFEQTFASQVLVLFQIGQEESDNTAELSWCSTRLFKV